MRTTWSWLYRPVLAFFNRPEAVLAGTFAALILGGTMLLALPPADVESRVGLLDALFTATSAVCVTGLTVVDTGRDYTRFGQAVIVGLIQIGGLGIMTFTALATQLLGRRLSFKSQALLADTFYQGDAATALRADLGRIVTMTFLIEFAGALILLYPFTARAGEHPAFFSAVFHAISAFCNAGFSLYPGNLTPFRNNQVVMWAVMALIILGGLGHTVLLEVYRRFVCLVRGQLAGSVKWSLNSRVVLATSAILVLGGALLLAAIGLTADEHTWGARIMNSLFQSVTARTAGFNTIEIGALSTPALLVLVLLMFIGGSPGSCAGGVKTTSAAVAFAEVRARLTGTRDVNLWNRRISPDITAKATLVIGLAVLWNMLGVLLLSMTETSRSGVRLEDVMFEQVSAFGTVGLSTGLTPRLSVLGKVWIIATMFVGRVGPLTAAIALAPREQAAIRYPEERMMIG